MIDALSALGSLPLAVAAFLAAVGIVVFVHEAGHYLAARASGIEVLVFSVGFGPPLVKKTDRLGTEWRVGVLPIGGYVKFSDSGDASPAGPADSGSRRGIALPDASLFSRTLTVAAGPLANFIASAAVFAALAMATGIIRDEVVIGKMKPLPGSAGSFMAGDQIIEINGLPVERIGDLFSAADTIPPGAETVYTVKRGARTGTMAGPHPLLPIIESVRPASAAAKAGLRRGDVVLSVDGARIHTFGELGQAVQTSEGRELLLEVWRQGQVLQVHVRGQMQDIPLPEGGFRQQVLIGVGGGTFFEPATETPGLLEASWIGLSQTASIITGTVNGLVWMARGDISTCNIQGPIGIARISAGAAQQGLETFVRLIALLSTAIGFVNLLPIPGLDGGHLVFNVYEGLTGKPPSERLMRYLTALGFALIAVLLTFGIFNDLTC